MKKVVVLALLLFVCVGSIIADDKDKRKKKSITDSLFRIDEVTVMEKRKTIDLLGLNVPLKFVPMTVTRLSARVLERKGVTEWDEAVRFLPGVRMTDQGGAFKRFYVGASNSPAVFMIDGLRDDRAMVNTFPVGDLSSAESIEVLKGPAAILAGYGAMGGVINVVRKKVSSDFMANARISYGSWDVKKFSFGFGGKLLGPVEYRANVFYSSGDGWRDNAAERFSGFAALGATLGKSRVDVTLGLSEDDQVYEMGAAPFMPGDMFDIETNKLVLNSGTRNPRADYKQVYNDVANNMFNRKVWNIKAVYLYSFANGIKLKESFSFNHSYLNYCSVEGISYKSATSLFDGADYKYYTSKGVLTYVDIDSVQRRYPLGFYPRHNTLNNTVELTGDLEIGSTLHHYTLGWSYDIFDMRKFNGWNEDKKDPSKNDIQGPGVKAMLAVQDPQLVQGYWTNSASGVDLSKYYTQGIYLRDVFELNEEWKFMAAGRMDFYKRKTASGTTTDGRRHYDDENIGDWNVSHTAAFTWHVGIVYFPRPELSVYAATASSFSPNTTSYNPMNIYIDRSGKEFFPDQDGGEVFKPTRDYSAELGVRYTLNEWLDVNASISYIRRLNLVKNVGTRNVEEVNEDGSVDVVEKNIQAQVGTGDTRSLNLDFVVRPLPTLQVTAALSVSDYRSRAIRQSDAFPEYVETAKNMRSTGVARTTYYAYADYTIPSGVLKNLSFHLSGNFRDKVFQNIASRAYSPALWLMDGGVFYTIRNHVTLSLNVNNLFDKEYFNGTKAVLEAPRNYQVAVSYNF